MYITEEQLRAREASDKNLNRVMERVGIIEITKQRPGRNEGVKNLDEEERNQIAIRSRTGETQTSLAHEFNVTTDTVCKIENGKVKGIDEERVAREVNDIRDKALQKLMASLNLLSEEKLSKCNARDISTVSANMSRVVEKMMPKENQIQNTQVIIYAPELRQEKYFDVVEVSAK